MMEKHFFLRLVKLITVFAICLCFLFTPLGTLSQANAGVDGFIQNNRFEPDSDSACIPLDIVIAVDQSTTMATREDPDGLRIEAVKYLITVLAENGKSICSGTTDRISVVYIGDTERTSVQIKLTPISLDLISRLQPEDLGNRDISTGLDLIDLELKEGERSRQENAKSVVILISSWLGSPCLAGENCTPSKVEPRILATKNTIDNMVATQLTIPSFHVIGISPSDPEHMGYFANNSDKWTNALGENGEFIRIEPSQVFLLAEDLVSIIEESGQRSLSNSGCASFTVNPFTQSYDVFVFSKDSSSNTLPIFETDTSNSALPGSLTRSFIGNDNSDESNVSSFTLNDAGVGGRVSFTNGCESTIVFSQSSPMIAKQEILEDPIPKMYESGNPIDDKYKLILTYENSADLNWTALCQVYDFDFDVEIKDPNHNVISWDSSFICDPGEKRFISQTDLPNTEEGKYSISVSATASSNSIDPVEVMNFTGSYSVKTKQRIGFVSVSPKAEVTEFSYPIHGALFSKYWLKEQPLNISVKLIDKETGEEINPLNINDNQSLKTITATIVENNSSLTEHEFTLMQSPNEPSLYTGAFSEFNPEISDYTLYVSIPQNSYDQILFSQDDLGVQITRKDDLTHSPFTYYTIFFLIFAGLVVYAVIFLKSYSQPLRGILAFYRPGDLSVPIARIDLAPGHKKTKVLTDEDLKRVSPFLSGISKMDIDAVYQDGMLNAVNLGVHYPDMDVPQQVLLGVTTINRDATTNQYTLGTTIAESMKPSVMTKTGSMIVFTKE